MFYYWGQLDDPVATRLGLPLHIGLIFFTIYALSRKPWGDALGPVCIVCSAAFIWFFSVPNVAQSKYMRVGYDARQIDWAKRILEDRKGPLLVLYDYHLAALVDGISAVPIRHGIERKPELNFHAINKTFSEILLIQREPTSDNSDEAAGSGLEQDELKEHFDLEPLYSYDLGPGYEAVIHRINRIRLSEKEQRVYQEHLAEFRDASADPKADLTAYFSKWLP